MKNIQLLIYATAVCLALGTEASNVTIRAFKGQNVTLDCVTDHAQLLEPPPGCILDRLQCLPYQGLRKYLCFNNCEKPLIDTYVNGHFGMKYRILYEKKKSEGTLKVTILGVTSKNTGLYTCGLQAPSGRHVTGQFMLSVMDIFPLPPERKNASIFPMNQPSRIQPGSPTVKKPSTVSKVVRAEEGQNVTIECPLEHLAFMQPPNECFDNKQKCFFYFQPLLYLHKEQGSLTILTQDGYAEYQRFSIKYGEKFLTVGITNLTKADSGLFICGVEALSGKTSSLMFEVIVSDAVTVSNRRLLLLLLIPALLLPMAAGLFCLIRCKKRKSNKDVPRADASRNTEVELHEHPAAAVSKPVDAIYQNLSPNTRDQNQTYCSLNSQ